MRLTAEIEEYDYFCIFCSNERQYSMRTDEPSAFIEGMKCEECGHSTWAYSPPVTNYRSDM